MSQIRETWLIKAVESFRSDLFKQHGHTIPAVKVSVGFPGAARKSKAIGSHWSPEASDDKVSSIFISPTVDDGLRVLDILIHELVHAVVGNQAGHGPLFRKLAVKVGLTGKMTSTVAGPELKTALQAVFGLLGPYPHSKLNLSLNPTKKQTTRMIKMQCPECGYIVRSSRSSIEAHGPCICPCNDEPMQIAGES